LITFIEHEDYYKHKMPQILESPRRLKIITKALEDQGIYNLPDVKKASPDKATEVEVRTIHTDHLVDLVKHGSMIGITSITGDTITNEFTFEAALRALGGAKLAAEIAWKNTNHMTFALVRPPGHHATNRNAMGFCFFNNLAFAANYLIANRKLKRIAIIDFDNHYGNGTADIFYDRSDILTISLHSEPDVSFPYQGRINELGEREGEGYNICIPLPNDTGDREYLPFFDRFVTPIVRSYKPEIILVSAGYDGLKGDPYGYLGLSPYGYQSISEKIQELATDICFGKIAYCLEGGYKYDELDKAFLASISPFIKDYTFSQEPSKKWSSGGNKNILRNLNNDLKEILKNYWQID